MFIAALAPVMLKERLERDSLKALALSMTGLIVIMLPSIVGFSYTDLAGIGLALTGTFCLTLITIITKKLNISAAVFVYYKLFIAAVCLLPFIRPGIKLTTQALILAGVIGLVHTALGYIFYYDGLKNVKIQYAATLTYFAPIVAALTGFFLFQEPVTLYTVIGGLLIVANGIFVTLKS